jgi:hypothetical protein
MSILSANISAKTVTIKRNPIFGDNQILYTSLQHPSSTYVVLVSVISC